ncbi:MAG: TatD family hydrolase [Sedimenticola sp.]
MPDSRLPEAFDSHFHLDRTIGILKLPATASLDSVLRHILPPKEREVALVGSVAVFCDPISYPTPDDVRNLRAQGMTVAVRLHPKNAKRTSSNDIQALRRLVKMPEVVGFGEIDLDQTTPVPEWDDQIDVLREMGRYIEKRHVVILHCRSNNQDRDFSIYRIMHHNLKQCSVPRQQKIHLHCFSGDKQAVKDWLEEYPNTYFGFTRLVDTFSSEQKEAVNYINDTRLLLETDAPYFQFRRYLPRWDSSTPALIGLTALEVAQVRQTTWKEILKITTANAQRHYCNK